MQSGSSQVGSSDELFVPDELTVAGFCTCAEVKDSGWTREMLVPHLKYLKELLPLDLKGSVSEDIGTISCKNLKFSVSVTGSRARDVVKREFGQDRLTTDGKPEFDRPEMRLLAILRA